MMGRVTINRDAGTDADTTSVSNIFIDEYMTEANDAQLKIYLFLLRTMRAGLSTSLSDLADRFNLTEKDVTRALRFWEKRGLVSMEYDRNKALSGIHLEDLSRPSEHTDEGKEAEPVSERASAVPASIPAHPAAEAEEEPSALLFIAERYLGRPLSVADTRSLLYIRDTLEFTDDMVDYLMQYCIERGKKDFRYMERVAIRWKEAGYETPEQAKRGSFKYDKRVYEVMDLLGLSNNVPTETEAAFVERWLSEYRLSIDVIREACARTVLATNKRRLEYANKILTGWHEAGVVRKTDIRQLDEAHEASRRVSAPRSGENAGTTSRQSGRRSFSPRTDYNMAEIETLVVKN